MTLHELYRSFLNDLSGKYSSHEASNITTMIFEHVAGLDRSAVIRSPGLVLSADIIGQIRQSLAELQTDKPVQYIIGQAWFYRMKLKVSAAVLIPRPETEELVSAVLDSLKNKRNAAVLDIGTGSGCIAIAIKKNAANAILTAIDTSSSALEIARENAASQLTEINFIETNFLAAESWKLLEKFDVIVSNPPYIPEKESAKMDKNVTAYEPHIALFVANEQPLVFYEKIAAFSKTHLKENGMVFMETHEDLAGEVALLFPDPIYKSEIKKDIFEKERMVIVTRCR